MIGSSFAVAQTPSNNCGTNPANEYPVNTNACIVTIMNSTNNSNSLPAGSGCGAANLDDAWAWFTATGTSTTVTYFPDTRNAILNVYSGACGALTQVGCSNVGGNGVTESTTFVTIPGNTYFIRIQRAGSNQNMTGQVCIVDNCAPAPANDATCSATAIPTPLDGVTSCLTGETNVCAGPDWTGGCVTDGAHTVWYTATLSGANNVMDINLTNATFGGSGNVEILLLIKNDVCPLDANMTLVDQYCGAPAGPIQFTGLTPGQQYHIMVTTADTEEGNFDICVVESTLVIGPGDNCASAIRINCGDPTTAGETTTTNTDVENGWTCGGFTYPGGDRWYVVQWPDGASGGQIRVTIENASDANNTLMEVIHVGTSCAGPPACTDMRQFDISTGLYNGSNSNSFDFSVPAGIVDHYFVIDDQIDGIDAYDITITCFDTGIQLDQANTCGGEAPPCNWRLDMFDSFGDGWNGGFADLYVNAVNTGPHAAAGFSTLTPIAVNTGDALQLDYTSGGGGGGPPGYESENTMIWRDRRQVIQHFETPNMTTGILWTGTAAVANCGFDPANPDEGVYQTWDGVLAPASADPTTMTGTYTVCENLYLQNPVGFEWLKDVVIDVGDCWTNITNITPNGTNTGFYNVDGDWSGTWNGGTRQITYNFTNSIVAAWGDGNNGTPGYTCNLYQFCYDAQVDPACSPINGFRNGLDATDDGIGGGGGSTGAANVNLAQTSPTINALPVELVSFTAEPIRRNETDLVELQWVTASEERNAYFTIERSLDGEHFTPLFNVAGAGTTSETSRYIAYDDHPYSGISYYRLKQTDLDGASETFHKVAVELYYGSVISISPIPAINNASIKFKLEESADAQWIVYDATGKKVEDFKARLDKGISYFDIDVTKYNSGIYFIHFRIGNKEYKERLLIK